MRRILVVLALTLGLLTVSVAPAGAAIYRVGGNGAPIHHNAQECGGRIYVYGGGGSGFQYLMRQAVVWYNELHLNVAGREGWPTLSFQYVGWDGYASNNTRCVIDVDEYSANDNIAGYVKSFSVRSDGHLNGCGIMLNGFYWSGASWEDTYMVRHELMHCLGLNHNFDDPYSLMSYGYKCICLQYEDRSDMSHVLYPRGVAHHT